MFVCIFIRFDNLIFCHYTFCLNEHISKGGNTNELILYNLKKVFQSKVSSKVLHSKQLQISNSSQIQNCASKSHILKRKRIRKNYHNDE
jgi:hypothetical protein